MYKNILQSIQGIEIYPIFSMMIFITLFAFVMYWFFKADKRYLQKMESLPFEIGENEDKSLIP